MKRILFVLGVFTLFSLTSCNKENLDSPGKINGMGNTAGDLQIKEPFTFPDGIDLIGNITGTENPVAKAGDSKSNSNQYYGSGGKMVKLTLTLLNSTNIRKTVFFPKGLLWQCKVPGYQNAILLQTTWISLNANSQRTIVVDLYCVNQGLDSSDGKSIYQILGVSSSDVINRLLNLIGWRKINYEMIYGTFSLTKSGSAGVPTYDEITDRLQTIVWNLTNSGINISAEDQVFIESIPELSPSEIPVLDSQSRFPEYFEEFIVEEN